MLTPELKTANVISYAPRRTLRSNRRLGTAYGENATRFKRWLGVKTHPSTTVRIRLFIGAHLRLSALFRTLLSSHVNTRYPVLHTFTSLCYLTTPPLGCFHPRREVPCQQDRYPTYFVGTKLPW